jgi:hypothetical protein
MKRSAGTLMLLAALSGCMSSGYAPSPGGYGGGGFGPRGGGVMPGLSVGAYKGPPSIPGMEGPMGERIAMAAPYSATPPPQWMAYNMMGQNVPLSMVQQAGATGMPGAGSGVVQAQFAPPGAAPPAVPTPPGGLIAPPGMPFGPGGIPSPGPGIPGAPGLMPGSVPPPGAVPAVGALTGKPGPFAPQRTSVRFVRPSGMRVTWFTQGPDGKPSFSTTPIEAPGRYNFLQAAIYRLKLSNIEGRPGLDIYPTLEVVPTNPRTEAFLAHSAVPIEFTDADFNQVVAGNYVVKVIYLPAPQFQEVAATALGEIVSTTLEPGQDPIIEAQRRGSILLVIRMGNIDLEAPNTPSMDAPGPHGIMPAMPHGMVPAVPGPMVPYVMPPGAGPVQPGAMAVPPGAVPVAPVPNAQPVPGRTTLQQVPQAPPVSTTGNMTQTSGTFRPASPERLPELLPPVPTPAELARPR